MDVRASAIRESAKHLAIFFAMFCSVLLPAVMIPSVSRGAGNPANLWISATGEYSVDAIGITQVDDKSYLFLPGNLDMNTCRIGFDSEKVFLNGEELHSAQTPASVLHDEETNELLFVNGLRKRKITLVLMRGDNLPSIHITTESGSLKKIHQNKKNKEPGCIVLCDADRSRICEGELKHIKMRGNASTKYRKRNYAFKLTHGSNLLGMGRAKKWVLLGNHLDKSLIRNQITFDMARYAGLDYTPECRQVLLYINHEYLGLYLLTEKIEVDDDRVDIRDLEKETEALNEKRPEEYPAFGRTGITTGNCKGFQIPNEPDDISGGYIIEYEHDMHKYTGIISGCITKRGRCLRVVSPEYCSEAQINYISSLMQHFENAIFAKDGRDPDTGKHYSELADFDSLVNKYLINEVSKNYDSNISSEYFYKPDDSVSTKIYAGPVWDMDNTYGDYARPDTKKNLKPGGIYTGARGTLHFWWPGLYRQPDFYQAVVKRYHDTFVPAIEILLGLREGNGQLKSIDTYAAAIEKSSEMEFVLYPMLKTKRYQVQTGATPRENIEYLKRFIAQRMEFLSGEWIQK